MERLPPISPRRFVFIGDSGTGKTTLARAVAGRCRVPFVDLDALYWLPEWRPRSDCEFRRLVAAATAGAGWSVAGNYAQVRDLLWPLADCIVWLDLPLPRVVTRVACRSLKRWWRQERVCGDNREQLWDLLKLWDPEASPLSWAVVQHYPRRREFAEAMASERSGQARFLRFRSNAEADRWRRALRAAR